MTLKPLVYVAGPITNPEPMANTSRAIRIATDLLLSNLVTPYLPHLTWFWHLVTPLPYDVWTAYDLEVLQRCDALLRIPGESSGADGEVACAEGLGLPIFTATHDVLAWASDRQLQSQGE